MKWTYWLMIGIWLLAGSCVQEGEEIPEMSSRSEPRENWLLIDIDGEFEMQVPLGMSVELLPSAARTHIIANDKGPPPLLPELTLKGTLAVDGNRPDQLLLILYEGDPDALGLNLEGLAEHWKERINGVVIDRVIKGQSGNVKYLSLVGSGGVYGGDRKGLVLSLFQFADGVDDIHSWALLFYGDQSALSELMELSAIVLVGIVPSIVP